MLFTNLKRIIRSGFTYFWRNAFVSLSSVLIMVITIYVMGVLIFFGVTLEGALQNVQERVDINVYFTPDAQEEDILALRDKIENLPEVASVTYTSETEALEEFREEFEDSNELDVDQTVDVLGSNPLPASLSILAKEASEYDDVLVFLRSDEVLTDGGEQIIDEGGINDFADKEQVVNRLAQIIETTEKIGLYVTIFLFVLSILITFNTIRLAIYTSREEIAVMRLVGASDSYIRGPFVVAGIIGGVFAALIVLMIFYPLTYWLGPQAAAFFGSIDLFDYYVSNFLQLTGMFLGAGIFLGAISSYLAVRRYLSR